MTEEASIVGCALFRSTPVWIKLLPPSYEWWGSFSMEKHFLNVWIVCRRSGVKRPRRWWPASRWASWRRSSTENTRWRRFKRLTPMFSVTKEDHVANWSWQWRRCRQRMKTEHTFFPSNFLVASSFLNERCILWTVCLRLPLFFSLILRCNGSSFSLFIFFQNVWFGHVCVYERVWRLRQRNVAAKGIHYRESCSPFFLPPYYPTCLIRALKIH